MGRKGREFKGRYGEYFLTGGIFMIIYDLYPSVMREK